MRIFFWFLILFPALAWGQSHTLKSFCADIQAKNTEKKVLCLAQAGLDNFREQPYEFKAALLELDDVAFKYIFSRLIGRPHIYSFISVRPKNALRKDISSVELDECSKNYPPELSIRCMEHKAAIAFKQNRGKAMHICEVLSSDLLIDECKTLALSTQIEEIKLADNRKAKEELVASCSMLSTEFWKSECYFMLADKIASEDSQNFDELIWLCDLSNQSHNYHCFNHITLNIKDSNRLNFCKKLEQIQDFKSNRIMTKNQIEIESCFTEVMVAQMEPMIFEVANNPRDHLKESIEKVISGCDINIGNQAISDQALRECHKHVLKLLVLKSNIQSTEFLDKCQKIPKLNISDCMLVTIRSEDSNLILDGRRQENRLKMLIKYCEGQPLKEICLERLQQYALNSRPSRIENYKRICETLKHKDCLSNAAKFAAERVLIE